MGIFGFSNKERYRAIDRYLTDKYWHMATDKMIAKSAGVDVRTVRKRRKMLKKKQESAESAWISLAHPCG